MKTKKILLLLVLLTVSATEQCKAWLYPEHRDITVLAVLKLDPAHRAQLDQLWAQARKGFESRLNESVVDPSQGPDLKYLDYGAWPAIAGDHSTSSANMVHNILQTEWIMNVANVAALLKTGLASSKNLPERVSKMRDADLRLLRADPEYVSRAGANNVHFMIARPGVNTTAREYLESCVEAGAEPNLVATYAWYHASALQKAWRVATDSLGADERSALVLAMLADEAFALHFIEDAFSAGHVAGIWGNAALRKGTHDYYDEHGLEVGTWNRERVVLMGDAFMRPEDAERAALTVLISLEQILDAASLKIPPDIKNDQHGSIEPDTFNIAKALKMPGRAYDSGMRELLTPVLVTTPSPGLATGLGEIPRFRSELGPFLGIAPAAGVLGIFGGFSPTQQTLGVVPRIEFAVHVGLGLEGVLNESGDGLAFIDLGFRFDGASSTKLRHEDAYGQFGSILSAIPSREALYFRVRMPFYVVPGDLLLVAPILLLVAPGKFNNMLTTAGNGGLIPWQTGLITAIGRLQFVLGREIGVCFYGVFTGADSFLIPDDRPVNSSFSLVSMRTTQLDFPILEYRPFRTFSRTQSASLLIQVNAGVDIPGKVTMLEPSDLSPVKVHPIWMAGIRLGFDWRYYVANK